MLEIAPNARWAHRRFGRRKVVVDGKHYIYARGAAASIGTAQLMRMIQQGVFAVVPQSTARRMTVDERGVDALAIQAGKRLDEHRPEVPEPAETDTETGTETGNDD